MRHIRGRVVEVEPAGDLDAAGRRRHVAGGWRLTSLDLTDRADALAGARRGGDVPRLHVRARRRRQARRARRARAPDAAPVSVDTYRTPLYAPDELYDAPTYHDSLDARVYAWSRHRAPTRTRSLAQALHDHAIDDALADVGRRAGGLVGVMGGHAAASAASPAYADAARLGHALGRTLTRRHRRRARRDGGRQPRRLPVAGRRRRRSTTRSPLLARVPSFRPSVDAWARRRFDGARAVPGRRATRWASRPGTTATSRRTCSPPRSRSTSATPPARRSCSQVCDAGIVFLPGAGGTVQEIFQDACENYYADESSVAPMVLVGRRPTGPRTLPGVAAARRRSAAGRPMEAHVHLVDTVEEAAARAGWLTSAHSVAASWPQAPSISRPRVSRTVVGMPLASSRRTNSRSSARVGGGPLRARRRVERDQVDVHPAPVAVAS